MLMTRVAGVLLIASVLGAGSLLVLAADAPTGIAPLKERRLALVIGNGAYPFAPLRNAVNDARDFTAALKDSGFDVTVLENASLRDTRLALRDFGDRLKQQGGVGLFYFAGHGMQVKGRNYLIPVAAQIAREDEVEFEGLDANQVLEKLDAAGNRFNIVILDACRNNPFARAFRSSTQGLAQMDAPSGAVVAFATSPGSVASDGAGRNGLYTQYLIQNVQQPGLKIEEVFKQVRAAVRRDSNGMQTPWESTSLEGDFYFHPVDKAALDATRRQQDQARIEAAVRVAIVNERERARKEYEEAIGKGTVLAAPASTSTIIAALPSSEPVASPGKVDIATSETTSAAGVVTRPPPTAPTVVASVAPKPPASSATINPSTPSAIAPASGNVIGARLQGAIRAPQFAVGDEWELLSISSDPANFSSQPAPIIEKLTVVTNAVDRVWMTREVLDKPQGTATSPSTRYSVTADAKAFFVSTTGISGQQKLAFPLDAGTRWSYSNDYTRDDGGKFRDDVEGKVLNWEQVTVPAGTFWAIKIELKGWKNNLSGCRSAACGPLWSLRPVQQIEGTIWYSPEVKYPIKSMYRTMSFLGPGDVTTTQLIEFSTAASRAAEATAAIK
jgi:Caspase domain